MGESNSASSKAAERIAEVCQRFGFDYDAAPKEHISLCNLCGSRQVDSVRCNDRAGFSVSIFPCWGCGLVQLSPRMTAEAYADFYGRGIYRAIGGALVGKPQDNAAVARMQVQYAALLIEQTGEFIRPKRGGTLLDIGGSIGLLAKRIADEYDLRATVLDPAPAELAAAPEGVNRECGLVETWDSDCRTFDVVLMTQTVDHLLDIRGTLSRVRQMLAPGGVFIVDAVDWMAIANKGGTMRAALKIDHAFYLTRHTMGAYLMRAGFGIDRSFGTGTKVFYACHAGERLGVLPSRDTVWEVFSMLFRETRETVPA